MHIRRIVLAAALSTVLPAAWAADLYVVAHPGVTLSADEVRDVFVGEKQFAGAVKLVPLDNAALQADFQARALKLDAARYATLWSKKGFRDGLSPPAVRGTDNEVLASVKSTPGAVGYVSKPSADVKVINKY